MKNIKATLIAALCTLSLAAQAQGIKVIKTDGEVIEISASELDRIETFTGEEEVVDAYEAVDLGLPSGVKWATFNIGATAPEEVGDFFTWGGSAPQNSYNQTDYEWYQKVLPYASGMVDMGTDISGTEYDTARKLWGGAWRMPTEAETRELADNTSLSSVEVNGQKCIKMTSKINGNSILMPIAGYKSGTATNDTSVGYYWASTILHNTYTTDGTDTMYWHNADAWELWYDYLLIFTNKGDGTNHKRWEGLLIRPVKD